MEKVKKLISIILILILTIVPFLPVLNVDAEDELIITTYGENEDGINPNLVTNKANLTVSGIENTDEFSVYKIIDVFYDESTNEMTYDFTSDFKTFLQQSTNESYKNMTIEGYFTLTGDNVDGSASTSVITTSTLNILVSNYTTYLRKNDTIVGINMTKNNQTSTVEVTAGAYLVLPSATFATPFLGAFGTPEFSNYMYGVMVGNITFTVNNNGDWILEDETIYAKKSYNTSNSSFVKFSMEDYFNFLNGIGNIDIEYYQNISSYINKKQVFFITFRHQALPTNAINTDYKLQITLPEGMSYDKDDVYFQENNQGLLKVSGEKLVYNNGEEFGTISFDGQIINLTIDPFTADAVFQLAFDVWLNENATVGYLGNEIITTLAVPDDPYLENSNIELTTPNVITTYGLELTSFNNDNTILLKGAKYEVYTSEDLATDSLLGEFEVGEDGSGTFAGVAEGTVYLKQTKAPVGYQLIKEVIPVKIAIEDSTDTDNDYYYEVATTNQKMWFLPSTGGIGTVIYTIVGLAIIGIASIFLIKYRKNTANM